MTSERHHNIWDVIEDDPTIAENLRIRAELMSEIAAYLKRSGMTQAQAAAKLGVTQPRISDLTRGKIDLFSIDTLVNMVALIGLRLQVRVYAAS